MNETIRVYYRKVDRIPVPYSGGGIQGGIQFKDKPFYHKFIIYTNSNGQQFYIGAFPEKGTLISGLAQSVANSSDPTDYRQFNTGRGKIEAYSGEWTANKAVTVTLAITPKLIACSF
jgi:hypothetical protein